MFQNVSTFLGSTWFVCFAFAFAFGFALSVFCRLLPSTPQQGAPPSHLQPPGESPAITVRGWPSYPPNPTARPSIDLSLWCHTGTHNNEGPQTFWRYPACSCCFSRNQQHAAHLVRAMPPLPYLLFLLAANIFAYSFDVARQVLYIFISVYIPAYMNCKSGRHGTRLSLTQLRGPTHF